MHMKISTKIILPFMIFLFMGSMAFSQVLWGGAGDPNGEFDGGLNDWTAIGVSAPNALWEWQADADASEGAYASPTPIGSPSAANGAAVFDSDFYDNGGVQGNFGLGTAPAPHTAELVSPIIDLTGQNFVSLEFYQYYRKFQSDTYVIWSNDGGTNWTDTVLINDDILVNSATAANDRVTLHLLGAGGTSQFRFKFLFEGEYYFWIIDDVSVIVRPDYDLVLGEFFYPASSYEQPRSQITTDTMGFFVAVSNYGQQPATNVSVKAEVLRGSNVLFTTEFVVDELAAETIDSFIELPDVYPPGDLNTGNYSIRYTATNPEGDYDTADNTKSAPFRVSTANRYSKEDNDENFEIAWILGQDHAVGNLYRTSTDWVDEYVIGKVTTSVAWPDADPVEGKSMNFYLMRIIDDFDLWDNSDFDNINFQNHPRLELRGFGAHTYAASTQEYGLVDVNLEDIEFNTPGVLLAPGEQYILFANYEGEASTIYQVYNQKIQYLNVISTIVISDQWYTGGISDRDAAVLRMEIDLYSTADEKPLQDNALTFFPNPASDVLNVELSLEQPSLANITIADIDGSVILIDEIKNAYQDKRQYDVSSLPSGTYIVRVATKEGTKTKKFVVQH
jgi:hypothetical protein